MSSRRGNSARQSQRRRFSFSAPLCRRNARRLSREGFIPAVSSIEEATAYSRHAVTALAIHLVIDTGMGRIGIWQDEAVNEISEIMRLPGVEITGVATHLPVADEDEAFTEDQLPRFEKIVARLRELGLRAPLIHSLNSAGVIRFGKQAGGMVRAGLMLYGISPILEFQTKSAPCHDAENPRHPGARCRRRPWDQLRTHLRHAAADARRHARRRLCGRLPAPPFKPRGGSADSRQALRRCSVA